MYTYAGLYSVVRVHHSHRFESCSLKETPPPRADGSHSRIPRRVRRPRRWTWHFSAHVAVYVDCEMSLLKADTAGTGKLGQFLGELGPVGAELSSKCSLLCRRESGLQAVAMGFLSKSFKKSPRLLNRMLESARAPQHVAYARAIMDPDSLEKVPASALLGRRESQNR